MGTKANEKDGSFRYRTPLDILVLGELGATHLLKGGLLLPTNLLEVPMSCIFLRGL